MKLSQYNYFFEVNDHDVLAYNTLTTALVRFTTQEFKHIQEFLADPQDDFFETADREPLKKQLVDMGIFVAENADECALLQAMWRAFKQRDQLLGLTIIPTLNCNFRCSYCFSYARKERMSHEVQDALLRFAERQLPEVEGLSVAWFGGEPTLCLGVIEHLSEQFAALCEKYHARLSPGSIVTNGYLLNEKVARRLRSAGITSAQITIDGDREIHDARRPLAGGGGTFDRIMDNVGQACDILQIQIRINVDRTNADTAIRALDTMQARGLQGKVSAYFGHVAPFTELCADVASDCLTGKEFGTLSVELIKQAVARGFTDFPYPRSQLAGVCGADKRLSYVVAPDGYLFKCWAEASLGETWSVGNVQSDEPTPQQNANLRKYLDWNPFTLTACTECRLMPICMGGCPYLRLHRPAEADCSNFRYTLLETLALRSQLAKLMPSAPQPLDEHAEVQQGDPVRG